MAAILSTAGIIHLSTVVPALDIGAAMLLRPKGTVWHKRWGRAWVLLMVVADLSSFWLQRDGYGALAPGRFLHQALFGG